MAQHQATEPQLFTVCYPGINGQRCNIRTCLCHWLATRRHELWKSAVWDGVVTLVCCAYACIAFLTPDKLGVCCLPHESGVAFHMIAGKAKHAMQMHAHCLPHVTAHGQPCNALQMQRASQLTFTKQRCGPVGCTHLCHTAGVAWRHVIAAAGCGRRQLRCRRLSLWCWSRVDDDHGRCGAADVTGHQTNGRAAAPTSDLTVATLGSTSLGHLRSIAVASRFLQARSIGLGATSYTQTKHNVQLPWTTTMHSSPPTRSLWRPYLKWQTLMHLHAKVSINAESC